jgi:membrane fusion protein (multidrug efflux system)
LRQHHPWKESRHEEDSDTALRAVGDLEAYLRVTALVDGVITERNIHPGALVGPSSGGGPAIPMLRVAEAIDVNTRTMAVELDVDNTDGRLAPGTFCQVRWPVHRSAPSLFVPSSSVASTTDRTFVVRVRDGKAEWVDVKTGLTAGVLVEVFGTLQSGDEVAGRGTDELRPGMEVKARVTKPAGT